MAKILVIDAEEKTQVPFLRGILTRSLQDAGVSFETAYSLASRIREDLRGRGRQSPHRRAERYLENFDDIWRLQDHLLDQADKAGIPIIANDDCEEVFRKIMLHVIDRLSDGFAATPPRHLRRADSSGAPSAVGLSGERFKGGAPTLAHDTDRLEEVVEMDAEVDALHGRIVEYLAQISSGELSRKETTELKQT